ncbi:MAG: pimeloyl-ACP methyl ester carboxylesterase [Myxococcota bacterium]|jgi:pimeloyl-ACP methyl ester carboxylesterase
MILALLVACHRAHTPPTASHCQRVEQHLVETEDGAAIHLHRHPTQGPPILVLHGISANHRSWDLSADRSIATALNAAGYDAWLLDLRGHGLAHVDTDGREQRSGWSMADYARYDLPAAITFIQEETGFEKLGFVGHSMGGMVLTIYNHIHGDDAFAAIVAVASPVDFASLDPLLAVAERAIAPGTIPRRIPAPALGKAVSGANHLPLSAHDLLWSASNMSDEARELLLDTIASPMSRQELIELRQVLRTGHLPAMDSLPELTAPLLVIAGRADRIAPPDRVRPLLDQAGSAEKAWFLAGRVNGLAHDYGHLDLVIGDAAAEEIYPRIVSWFDGRWSLDSPTP